MSLFNSFNQYIEEYLERETEIQLEESKLDISKNQIKLTFEYYADAKKTIIFEYIKFLINKPGLQNPSEFLKNYKSYTSNDKMLHGPLTILFLQPTANFNKNDEAAFQDMRFNFSESLLCEILILYKALENIPENSKRLEHFDNCLSEIGAEVFKAASDNINHYKHLLRGVIYILPKNTRLIIALNRLKTKDGYKLNKELWTEFCKVKQEFLMLCQTLNINVVIMNDGVKDNSSFVQEVQQEELKQSYRQDDLCQKCIMEVSNKDKWFIHDSFQPADMALLHNKPELLQKLAGDYLELICKHGISSELQAQIKLEGGLADDRHLPFIIYQNKNNKDDKKNISDSIYWPRDFYTHPFVVTEYKFEKYYDEKNKPHPESACEAALKQIIQKNYLLEGFNYYKDIPEAWDHLIFSNRSVVIYEKNQKLKELIGIQFCQTWHTMTQVQQILNQFQIKDEEDLKQKYSTELKVSMNIEGSKKQEGSQPIQQLEQNPIIKIKPTYDNILKFSLLNFGKNQYPLYRQDLSIYGDKVPQPKKSSQNNMLDNAQRTQDQLITESEMKEEMKNLR